MKCFCSLFATGLLAITLLWTPVASAGQVFAAPDENGKIERLDLRGQEVVVGDTLYRLARGVAVYTHRGFQTTVDSLKKGMRIAFNVKHDQAGSPYVYVIWILSKK